MTMLEDDLIDLDPGDSLEKGRPAFLTGLCITSWVGCGLILLTTLYSLYMVGSASFSSFDGAIRLLQTFGFTALCAFGAFGMWQLKKWGFYLYLVGELGPVGFTIWEYYKLTQDTAFAGIGINSLIFSLSGIITFGIPLIFCILYGTNFKHLR